MKRWLRKLVLSFTLVSLACFYSGGAMAMGHEMNMNGKDNCSHCYSQKALACDFDQAIVPLKLGKNDFDQPNCDGFSFGPVDFPLISENKNLFDRPPEKGRFIPDHFINNKVVLLI